MIGIKEKISKANNILLIGHKKPDGDACGSALAMFHYLKHKNKNSTVFFVDLPPKVMDFLPGIENTSTNKYILNKKWDLLIFLDCGDLKQSGIEADIDSNVEILNIDHHVGNNNFGDLNLVKKASSTCEIIYDFFKFIDFEIESKTAQCLLTGIITDTGGFTNAATSSKAIAIAGELVSKGARVDRINKNLTNIISLQSLKLWGLIFSRLNINKQTGLVYTYVNDYDLKDLGVTEEQASGVVNFLNNISDAKGVAFFKVGEVETKVSLRTNRDDIDMSTLAKEFGGGGHRKAAGFSIDQRVNDFESYLSKINTSLKK